MAKTEHPQSRVQRYLPSLSESGARWARFLGVLLALLLFVWLVLELRGVLTPIAAALAIAYILNPLVTWLEHRGVQRVTSITVIYILGTGVVLLGAIVLGAKVIEQVIDFGQSLPGHLRDLWAWTAEHYPASLGHLGTSQPSTTSAPASPGFAQPLVALLQEHGVGAAQSVANLVGRLFSNVTYILTLTVLLPMYTFFFLWKFDPMLRAVRDHLPARYRPVVVRIASTIDRATAEFFRGRLIISAIVGVLTAVGWWVLVDFRYCLPLGLLVGMLNLVPILPLIALPPALLFTYLDAQAAGQSWLWPIILTMTVFMAGQALENFLLSPWISGKSSGLHPITTVVALLIGAQLAGLLGMLLSIPLASTLKSLGGEFLMPEIKRLAREPEADGAAEQDTT